MYLGKFKFKFGIKIITLVYINNLRIFRHIYTNNNFTLINMNSTPNLTFYEIVNKEPTLKLSNITFENFLKFYDEPTFDENNDFLDQKTQFGLLKSYCFQHIKNKFQPLKRDYSYARNKSNGRIFVSDKIIIGIYMSKYS